MAVEGERAPSPTADAPVTAPSSVWVGAANDVAESDADRTAAHVMRVLSGTDKSPAFPRSTSTIAGGAQRVARRPLMPSTTGGVIRRLGGPDDSDEAGEWIDLDDESDSGNGPEEESDSDSSDDGGGNDSSSERVQRSALSVRRAAIGLDGGPVGADVASELKASRGRGQPLDAGTKSSMEGAFGADFGGVRVHHGSQADQLNRSMSASAFTLGSDVYFSKGTYAPAAKSGQRLLAHELAHVVQNGGARGTAHRQTVIRREFKPHRVNSKAHLRDNTNWSRFKGPKITSGSVILADDTHTMRQKDSRGRTVQKKGQDVKWRAALNAPPGFTTPIAANRHGWIRDTRVNSQGGSLGQMFQQRIREILVAAEGRHASLLTGALTTKATNLAKELSFLEEMGLRLKWFAGSDPAEAAEAFSVTLQRLDRIRIGANFLADSLDHWAGWLHPTKKDKVSITSLTYTLSDLHERGLGVVRVKFAKPTGGAPSFTNEKVVDVMVKPEDKELEEALIGDDPSSAANMINQIVGIDTKPNQALTTIKMHSDENFGAIIQVVKGMNVDDLVKTGGGTGPVTKSFHETLVFAFLAGLDDLHRDNVFWSKNGQPYLIDADNVLSMNQLLQKDNGATAQSGFTGTDSRQDAADESQKAIKTGDNSNVQSEILKAMLDKGSDVKRKAILAELRKAISGKKGRIVPVRTAEWGRKLARYPESLTKPAYINDLSDPDYVIRKTTGFDDTIGPGIHGVVGEHSGGHKYKRNVEAAQLTSDFNGGVVPFYEYEFSSGKVLHNQQLIYMGVEALDAAMTIIENKFSTLRG